jgi:hypothetical protein
MLYLYHEMDVNYLVVEEMINISKLFDYTCMFSNSTFIIFSQKKLFDYTCMFSVGANL